MAHFGIAQVETGQFVDAIKNLESALQKTPNDPDLLYYLGRASGLLSKQSVDTLLASYPKSARAVTESMAENYFVLRQNGRSTKMDMSRRCKFDRTRRTCTSNWDRSSP